MNQTRVLRRSRLKFEWRNALPNTYRAIDDAFGVIVIDLTRAKKVVYLLGKVAGQIPPALQG